MPYHPHIDTPSAQPRSVLITGASTGIGRACAEHLADHGWRVFAAVRKQQDVDALQNAGSDRTVPVMLDVTNAPHINDAAQHIHSTVGDGGLDGLVNNAGIGIAGPLEHIPPDMLREQFEVNVFGLMAVTQAMLPMLRRAGGRIVNISSVSGRLATPMLGPYSASKFAVEALSDALRVELRQWNMCVSLVEPGAIDTPIWEKGASEIDRLEKRVPPEALEQYQMLIDGILEGAEQAHQRAAPTALVARAVEHALTARKPHTRYPVGRDARIGALLARWMPDRWRDALLLRELRNAARRRAARRNEQ